jgi:predicted acylesterase/phospholipase RssA
MKRLLIIIQVLTSIVLVGCATPESRDMSTEIHDYMELPNGQNPLDPSESRRIAGHGGLGTFERKYGRPLKILQLSGGGQNGAFGAGVLLGWTESGNRPQFDWVTGISTGALMATFAFLGTPEDDRTLRTLYTEITQADVYNKGGLLRLIGGKVSLMDTTPLARLIATHVTAETLERVALEHEKGRRLAIGVTNLDYQQLWAWSLGEIAIQRTPEALELFRKLLLAAASPPIIFPPVKIDGHLFADGAIIDNLLIAGLYEPSSEIAFTSDIRGQIYTIHNGRIENEPSATTESLGGIIGRTVTISLDNGMGSSLANSYAAASIHNYEFYLLSVPPSAEVGENPLAFNQEEMRQLFSVGQELGQNPQSWARVPPTTRVVAPWMRDVIGKMSVRTAQ